MRTLSLCLLLAATACLGAAPPVKRAARDDRPGLHVHGETVLVVTKLPFEVHCGGPAADLYFWSLPPGWKAAGEDGDTLTVSSAPEGAATVKLVTLTFSLVDGKLQRKRDTHSLTVNVGKVTPPLPPVPPVPPGPVPPDELTKALADAYKLEVSPEKAKHLAALAALYRQAAKLDLGEVKTAGDLFGLLSRASRQLLPADALPLVRREVGKRLSATLPSETATVLSAAQKSAALALFAQLGAALEGAGQ